jgi:hypothetical protein
MALQDTDLLPVTRPSGAGAGTYRTSLAALKAATNSVSVGTTAPANPVNGQLWVDTSVVPPKLQIWNTTTSKWEVSSGGGVQAGAVAPTNPVNGQLWVDTSATPPALNIYDSTAGKWSALAGAPPDRLPILGAATLADVAGGSRFTNVVFPVVVTVTDPGSPLAKMKLRASVFGNLPMVLETDAIASQSVTTGPTYSSGVQGDPALQQSPAGGNFPHVSLNWGPAFDGNLTTFVTLASRNYSSLKFAVPHLIGDGKVEAYVKGSGGGSYVHTWTADSPAASNNIMIYDTHTLASPSWQDTGLVKGKLWNGVGLKGNTGDTVSVAAFRVDGVIMKDNMLIDSLVLTGATNFAALRPGLRITGKTSKATADLFTINAATFTLGLANKTGTFQVGEKLEAATVKVGTTLYTVHDATGLVSSLQSADPGLTAVNTASPYHLTFPATFPTGNAPDVDLPAGTTLKVELEASNAAGKATATTNTITPA